MLRALRDKYPKGSRLLWVCGDDVQLDVQLSGVSAFEQHAFTVRTPTALGLAGRIMTWNLLIAGHLSRFDWISNEKGQAMLAELDGLIVQRRLHKAPDNQADRFYKAPVDSSWKALAAENHVI